MDLRDELDAALGSLYSIETELGGGGMSRVFLAEEKALARRVVVKVLPQELTGGVNVDRFRREILMSAKLQHPHIVPLLATGEVCGVPYYTMPFAEGESLRSHLRSRGPLPIGETVGILGDVAKALAYAHDRGIIHRDIKPDNVLISHGAAAVTDFGIAKAVSDAKLDHGHPLTQLGMSMGTPTYMAPEQAAADPAIDHRADIYSFGCLAYEMLAGRPPFCEDTPRKLMAAQLSQTPEPVTAHRPDTPPALAALVMRCLAKEPADRPQRCADMARVLEILSAGEHRKPTPGARGDRLARRLALGFVGLVAVSILARASIIALGLPEWTLPVMLVLAVMAIVALIGRSRAARLTTPLSPVPRQSK